MSQLEKSEHLIFDDIMELLFHFLGVAIVLLLLFYFLNEHSSLLELLIDEITKTWLRYLSQLFLLDSLIF